MTDFRINKKIAIAVLVLLIFVSLTALSGCDSSQTLDVTYTGGNIPLGGEIDRSDLVVGIIGGWGTHRLRDDQYELSDFDSSTIGEKTVTVTYTDGDKTLTATFIVTVVESSSPAKLSRIEVEYSGGDIFVGGTLDNDKITVKAFYRDGSSKTVTGWTLDLDSSKPGDKTVTVYYTEGEQTVTDTFTVKIVEDNSPAKLSRIEVEYSGGDIIVGGTLDNDKITVKAVYTDGSSKTVSGWTLGDFDSASAGTKTVKVSYTENGESASATFEVQVKFAKLIRIEASYNGGELVIDEKINPNEVAVVAYFEDGSYKSVTGFVLSPESSHTAGRLDVTVTYTDTQSNTTATTVFYVNVQAAKPTALHIETSDSPVYLGDEVRPNLTVTVSYDDGNSKIITDYTLSDETFDTSGKFTVTVSYTVGEIKLQAEATFNVLSLVLEKIEATYTGGDLEINGSLDKDKLSVTAFYSNQKTKQITEGYTCNVDTSVAGEKQITVEYSENGVTVSASVTCRVVARVTTLTAEYRGANPHLGDKLNVDEIDIKVAFNDGVVWPLKGNSPGVELSPTVFDQEGLQTVNVTYTVPTDPTIYRTGSAQDTFSVIVLAAEKTLQKIEAVYTGGNIFVGAQPDKSKLTVTAYYSDGSSNTVTNFTVGTVDSSSVGTKQWEISYTEGETKTAYVTITVVSQQSSSEPVEGKYDVNTIKQENLSIHFLMLGNKYTGDSVYIKAGDTDILIDAGSRYDSASTITNYVNQYCSDGKLEYVIATHAHQDHIEGFVNGSGNNGGVLDRFKVDTVITYARKKTTSNISSKFTDKLNTLKEQGVNVYTANDCINNANGAQKEFTLADGITMEILDQKYYRQSASNDNNYSVCLMIKQGENNYLFTGDLEDDGEESLVQLNPNLPKVKLWKGGHHGSYTAGSTTLLKKIQPETVCICTCMGTIEYTKTTTSNHMFPAQEFVERVSQYTDRVYCTSDGTKYSSSSACIPANGNIVFACTNGQITMYFSNNNLKLKDTDWFKSTSWFKNNPNIHQSWYN